MKKKMLMRFAAVALAAGMCISGAGATYFSDVSSNAWYYDAVTKCSNYDLMHGYENGTFRPSATMTRAECAQILANLNPEWRAEIIYYDVNYSKWYWNTVSNYGNYMGGSYTDTNHKTPIGYRVYFYPEKACTREDFAYGLGCVLYDLEDEGGPGFNDYQQINPQYRDTIMKLRHNGIINGDGVGRYGYFHPKKTITRAEVAQILCNLIELVES